MQQLNHEIMREAIKTCVTHPGYKFLIVVENHSLMQSVRLMFEEEANNVPALDLVEDKVIYFYGADPFAAIFSNRSQIRTVCQSDSFRAFRVHRAYSYGNIDPKVTMTALNKMLCLYYGTQQTTGISLETIDTPKNTRGHIAEELLLPSESDILKVLYFEGDELTRKT